MTAPCSESVGTGSITSGIEHGRLPQQTISFVYGQLASWRDDPDRPFEEAEDKLNLQLCKFLDVLAREKFPMVRFDHEEYQGPRRRVDMSASTVETVLIEATTHTIYDPFVVLEGKRLPAPSSGREKEYVTSGSAREVSGGIQRFKHRLHGARLSLAVMIGYVQKRSIEHWHQTINGWICDCAQGGVDDGCTWGVGEKLKQFRADVGRGTSACKSVHERSSGGPIELRHLWVAMSRQSAG